MIYKQVKNRASLEQICNNNVRIIFVIHYLATLCLCLKNYFCRFPGASCQTFQENGKNSLWIMNRIEGALFQVSVVSLRIFIVYLEEFY